MPQSFSYRSLLCATLLLSIAWSQACATTPTGRHQFLIVPDAQIDAMGEEAFRQIAQEEPVEDDPAINRYVACVSDALVAQVEPDDLDWEIVVFASDAINAFALPGGYVGIYTGMLRVADTPDQLAAVIGHEIAHVLSRHASERVSQQLALGAGMEAVRVAMGDAQTRGLVLGALGVGAQVGVLLPFSRTHETEADIIGQELMAEAGFDPSASVVLWQRMQELSPNGPPVFLSTHPSHGRRVADLRENLNETVAIYERARAAGRIPDCQPP